MEVVQTREEAYKTIVSYTDLFEPLESRKRAMRTHKDQFLSSDTMTNRHKGTYPIQWEAMNSHIELSWPI